MVSTLMNINEVKKALVEVQTIIEKLSNEEYEKIPNDIKTYIEVNKDSNYIWEYDEEKTLEEQNLNECTLPILAYINNEYLLNEEQKEYMNNIYRENDKKLEEELHEKYNPNDIFKNKQTVKNEKSSYQMTEYKENIFTKILNFIKKIFK